MFWVQSNTIFFRFTLNHTYLFIYLFRIEILYNYPNESVNVNELVKLCDRSINHLSQWALFYFILISICLEFETYDRIWTIRFKFACSIKRITYGRRHLYLPNLFQYLNSDFSLFRQSSFEQVNALVWYTESKFINLKSIIFFSLFFFSDEFHIK